MRVLMILMATAFSAMFLVSCLFSSGSNKESDAPIVINEFMSSNQTDTILDDSGSAADWIELYNNSDEPYSLQGLYISDKASDPRKFALADTVLPARGYYLIWADNDVEEGPNHANFALNVDGEEIVLTDENRNTVDYIDYRDIIQAQQPNFSYGRREDGGEEWGIQATPTPGYENDG